MSNESSSPSWRPVDGLASQESILESGRTQNERRDGSDGTNESAERAQSREHGDVDGTWV